MLVLNKAILQVKQSQTILHIFYAMLKYQKPINFKTSLIPNQYRMLEEHGCVGGNLGEVAGLDAYVDEEPEDGRDVAVKVEGKHSTVNRYCHMVMPMPCLLNNQAPTHCTWRRVPPSPTSRCRRPDPRGTAASASARRTWRASPRRSSRRPTPSAPRSPSP